MESEDWEGYYKSILEQKSNMFLWPTIIFQLHSHPANNLNNKVALIINRTFVTYYHYQSIRLYYNYSSSIQDLQAFIRIINQMYLRANKI